MRRSVFAVLAACGLCGAFAGGARADDYSYTNLKKAEWQDYLDTFTPLGYRVTSWDVKVVDGEPRYTLGLS